MHQWKIRKNERGQIFALIAVLIGVLVLFVGLAIDFGQAYVTKTTLNKAVDAATLAAMRNLNLGQATATADAVAAFKANYQSVPGLGTVPTPTVTWFTSSPCISGNTCVTINATTSINTSFIRVLGSQFATLNVSDSATAQRNPLVMSLVLDRSGSMSSNGGQAALPTAVQNFISYFDPGIDNIAEISFSTLDTVDVPMTTSFVSPIDNSTENMIFGGATFAQAGLQDAFNQILTKPLSPNIIRVAVFFTDGYANTDGLPTNVTTPTASTTHDVLNCTGTTKKPSNTPVNYGGCAPVECSSSPFFMNPTSAPSTNPFYTAVSCPNATTFPVEAPGVSNTINITNITADATYRTEQLASVMRNSTNNITIYSIGLGDKINEPYLQAIANDPANAATYNPSQPQGQAIFAPDASQLDAVFQTIASKVLLRLSQ
ncbi:vWA domain-containing protein [Candidatus Binatus sp.]|uniref:vWA domain-containing protein n=1 Tax=Candidatus Binatus sp. TaxID=2811406 RepID=UPI003C616CD9